MLRLLPKDVVIYIYEIVHKSNTQDIINEYIQKVRPVNSVYSRNYYIQVNFKNAFYSYNDRDLKNMNYSYTSYVIRRFGVHRAMLPKRYVYSLTDEEIYKVNRIRVQQSQCYDYYQ